MRRRWNILAAAAVLAAGAAWAVTPEIRLPRARRGVVIFSHRAHAERYGVACDRCHHNVSPVPADRRTCKGCHMDLEHGGLCHDCHISTRDRDYARRYDALRQRLGRERIPTLFKAFHGLCRGCHARVNRTQGKRAPYECGGCHKP